MSMFTRKLGAAAMTAAVAASLISSSANADPKQYSALIGFGSDTTQDVMNALAGHNFSLNYTPVQTSTATGQIQLVSWDAFPANQCITTKVGAPTILRPNGSTNGRRILSRAFGGGTWPTSGGTCGLRNVSGLVDFARSSAGPAASGTDLTYIPLGRDALSYAYNKPSGSPVTSLTTAELTSLMVSGPQNILGTVIIPCGIQTGSGTYQSWNTANGLAATGTPDTGTAFCNTGVAPGGLPDAGGRLQESNGPELTIKANALATTSDPICDGVAGGAAVSCANAQVIVGFSASQFIARSNNVGSPNPGPGVALGGISGVGASPVNGTAPNLTPNAAFYGNTTFGRDVYNVVASEVLLAPADARIVSMFVGSTSAVCSAVATIQTHGFLSLGANCGSTSLTGPFVS